MSRAAGANVERRRFRHARRTPVARRLALTAAAVAAVLLTGLAAVVLTVGGAGGSVPDRAGSTRGAAGPASTGPAPARSAATESAATGSAATRSAPTGQNGAAADQADPEITYPIRGDGDWDIAPGRSAVAGTGGKLLRYQVAVERGIGNVDAADVADEVTGTLADPRSWAGSGQVRLQRVGPRDRADFVVYLATPATRDDLCQRGRDRYTSCRNGDKVVINVARWVRGAARVGGDLSSYRRYAVNHEVGHRLGHGHERCPGPGEPAPLMQQQTLGLHGCTPNPWPLVDGRRYRGPAGAYQDSIPQSDRRADERRAEN